MYRGLEDEFGDVVGKARRGQEIDEGEICKAVGIAKNDWTRIERYEWIPDRALIELIADNLNLSRQKLFGSAQKDFFPRNPAGQRLELCHIEMMVLGSSFLMNGYLVGCKTSGKALCVDPGFNGKKILSAAKKENLQIEQVILTHGHHDHVGALKEVVRETQARVHISEGDLPMLGELGALVDSNLSEGDIIGVGQLNFAVMATGGHTSGGISLIGQEAAFVGDALFAGSLGGTRKLSDYQEQRRAVDQHLLSLDEDLLLFPGHGPVTTVGEERTHNPFFA